MSMFISKLKKFLSFSLFLSVSITMLNTGISAEASNYFFLSEQFLSFSPDKSNPPRYTEQDITIAVENFGGVQNGQATCSFTLQDYTNKNPVKYYGQVTYQNNRCEYVLTKSNQVVPTWDIAIEVKANSGEIFRADTSYFMYTGPLGVVNIEGRGL